MTNAIDFTAQWLISGTVIVFLIVCVWHNRRTGYQRVRPEKITLGEAMVRIRKSLSPGDDALFVTGHQTSASIMNTTAEQLVCLNSSLERQSQIGAEVPADATVERPVVEIVI